LIHAFLPTDDACFNQAHPAGQRTVINANRDSTPNLDSLKTELNFLVTGNAAGFRNFSLVRQ